MTTFKLINQLSKSIKNVASFNNASNILKHTQITDYEKYANHKKGTYTRNLLYKNNIFDVYILTWDSKFKCKIHDHASNGCYLKVLKGNLKENIYDDKFNIIKTSTFKENMVSHMTNDIGYHDIENEGEDYSVSLHIYSPPNHKTKYFN